MKKKQIGIFFFVLVLFVSIFNTSTIEVQAESTLDPNVISDEITVNLSNESSNTFVTQRISLPNAVTVQVIPSETGLTIKVNNIGVDTVDRVSVTINYPKMYSQRNKTAQKQLLLLMYHRY